MALFKYASALHAAERHILPRYHPTTGVRADPHATPQQERSEFVQAVFLRDCRRVLPIPSGHRRDLRTRGNDDNIPSATHRSVRKNPTTRTCRHRAYASLRTHTHKHTHTHTHRHTNTHTQHKHTTDTHTHRHTDKQTNTHTNTHTRARAPSVPRTPASWPSPRRRKRRSSSRTPCRTRQRGLTRGPCRSARQPTRAQLQARPAASARAAHRCERGAAEGDLERLLQLRLRARGGPKELERAAPRGHHVAHRRQVLVAVGAAAARTRTPRDTRQLT